jgi:hypothetical protein
MRPVWWRVAAFIPVCRRQGRNPVQRQAGGAERAVRAEGKIKETGTMSARFLKLLLSAHWLGSPHAAPHFGEHSAGHSLNALALLAYQRHHSPKSGVSGRSRPEARP